MTDILCDDKVVAYNNITAGQNSIPASRIRRHVWYSNSYVFLILYKGLHGVKGADLDILNLDLIVVIQTVTTAGRCCQ